MCSSLRSSKRTQKMDRGGRPFQAVLGGRKHHPHPPVQLRTPSPSYRSILPRCGQAATSLESAVPLPTTPVMTSMSTFSDPSPQNMERRTG